MAQITTARAIRVSRNGLMVMPSAIAAIISTRTEIQSNVVVCPLLPSS
jgi:hypothetical protein